MIVLGVVPTLISEGSLAWMRLCCAQTCVEILPFGKESFTLLFSTNPTEGLGNLLKGDLVAGMVLFRAKIHFIMTTDIFRGVSKWLFVLWIEMRLLLHKKVGYRVGMIPALILVLFRVLDRLVTGTHFLHGSIFEYVVVDGFVGLCAGLLLEMLIFWMTKVCK